MNIMERSKTGIFSICVFNNLKKFCPKISPFFSVAVLTKESSKPCYFSYIDFCEVLAIHR